MREPLGALRQFLQRPRAAPGEKCEMCATPLSDDHSHVVNVETRQILDELAALGCDEAQGYAIARPMPADQVLAWIRQSGRPLPIDEARRSG